MTGTALCLKLFRLARIYIKEEYNELCREAEWNR